MPLPLSCQVAVYPSRTFEGDFEATSTSLSLEDALRGPWHEFGWLAHVSQYGGAPGQPVPRVNKAMLDGAGAEGITLNVMLIDVDRHSEGAWPSKDVAADALEDVLYRMEQAGLPAGGYTSRAGLRLVVPIHPPVPLAKAKDVLRGMYILVRKAVGTEPRVNKKGKEIQGLPGLDLVWDDTTDQWHRLFLTPHALRDGKPTDPYIVMPCTTFDASDLVEHAEVEKPNVSLGPDGVVVNVDVPLERWFYQVRPRTKAGVVRHLLRDGRPLPFDEGERNSGLLSVVRSLTKQLGHVFVGADELASAVYTICKNSVGAATEDGSPTLDELWSMCSRSGGLDAVEPEDAMSLPDGPLVVAHSNGQHFWLRSPDGAWDGPYTASTTAIRFRDHYPDLPHASEAGVPWAASKLAYAYGTTVRAVVYDQAEGGLLQEDISTLRVQLYDQRPKVPAKHDPDVAEWLDVLASGCPYLLDWLSWAPDLNHAIPALILQGDSGAGKSMISQALSGLFGDGAAADWKVISRNKSNHGLGSLLRSPMIVGDDVQEFESSGATGFFRSLTGNSTHHVDEKFLPAVQVKTATRVVLTANSETVLSIRGRHGQQDLDAIRTRVLAIAVGGAAAAWLEARGGKAFTHDWIETADKKPGRIAQHVMWLASQRNENWEGRFPVKAWISDSLREGAITGNSADREVWLAVITAVLSGRESIAHVREAGVVWVHAKQLHINWAALGRGMETRPLEAALTVALTNAAIAPSNRRFIDGRQRRYWPVASRTLVKVAQDLGLDELEDVLHIHEHGNSTTLPSRQTA